MPRCPMPCRLAVLLLVLPAAASAQLVYTLAGSGTQRSALEQNGVGTAASFTNPVGSAVSADGATLLVADVTALRRITIATRNVSDALFLGSSLGFDSVAIAPRGAALVDTVFTGVIAAQAIAVFYIAPSGAVQFGGPVVGGGSPSPADGVGTNVVFIPGGMVVNAAGDVLYAADLSNFVVRRINITEPTAAIVTTLCGGQGSGYAGLADGVGTNALFKGPAGLTFDATGSSLYIADLVASNIRRVDLATAAVTTFAGSAAGVSGFVNGPRTAALFAGVGKVALAHGGATMYVPEVGNCLVRAIDMGSGIVTTFAGGNGTGRNGSCGYIDGAASAAAFASPLVATLSADGLTLFVSDTNNFVVRAISLPAMPVSDTTWVGAFAAGLALLIVAGGFTLFM